MTALRLKPSGHVHDWTPIKVFVRGLDTDHQLHVATCEREALGQYLTADFPLLCRRCPTCFPPTDQRTS